MERGSPPAARLRQLQLLDLDDDALLAVISRTPRLRLSTLASTCKRLSALGRTLQLELTVAWDGLPDDAPPVLLSMRGVNSFPRCVRLRVYWDSSGYDGPDSRLELSGWLMLAAVLHAAVQQCPSLESVSICAGEAPAPRPYVIGERAAGMAAYDHCLAGALGALQLAPRLRQLDIVAPMFGGCSALAVARLTALNRLDIKSDDLPRTPPPAQQDLSPLRALTRLQRMTVRGDVWVAPPAPGSLGCYPSTLRELDLVGSCTGRVGDTLPALVSHLGSAGPSLEALTLRADRTERLAEVMPAVARLAPGLTSLVLERVWGATRLAELKRLSPCSAWTGLTALRVLGPATLSRSPVLALTAPQHFEVLMQLPRLEVLRGADVRCAPPPHLRLASLTSLTAKCSVTGPQLATLLCCCPRLEQLHCRLQPAPLGEQRPQQSAAGVAAPKGLASCTVVGADPFPEQPADLPGLAAVFEGTAPALQHVQSLEVLWPSSHLQGAGPHLPSLAALTSLTSLTLWSHGMSSTIRAGHVVAMVRGCRERLRELNLDGPPVLTPRLVQDLQDACPHLKRLRLSECWEPPEQEGGASTREALLEALRRQARPGLIVTA